MIKNPNKFSQCFNIEYCTQAHPYYDKVWEYTLTDCTVYDAKAVFSENSLEFSILIKMLHKIFGHNTDYVIFWCFVS